MKICFDGDQADAQGREVAVEIVVFGAGLVFAHACVADPMVAAFAAYPVAAGELAEVTGAARPGGMVGDVEGGGGLFVFVEGGGAFDHGERTRAGQVGFEGFEGIDPYRAPVEASVTGVGLFGVGKKGVPAAFCRADW